MRHVPAAMMHGGGGVLFMITKKFPSQETNMKHKIITKKQPPSQQNSPQNKNTKSQAKTTTEKQLRSPSNELTVEIQFFQMRKMDQR
jgi:hypothetical protein